MKSSDIEGTRRISVDLPNHLIEKFDQLKKEWGLRARGAVLRRLLEVILEGEDSDDEKISDLDNTQLIDNKKEDKSNLDKSFYDETTALVLISKANDSGISLGQGNPNLEELQNEKYSAPTTKPGINLPGFVRRNTVSLRESLGNKQFNQSSEAQPLVTTVSSIHIKESIDTAKKHWQSLYGQEPGETVIEAAMTWLARDIWIHINETDGRTFTWTEANRYMKQYCPAWSQESPSFERVIVIAGVLEDPFATRSLPDRIPTLIRRFVNRFRRSKNVTSFQTLESTMTVHGALQLLDLPTIAGAKLTLKKIRSAYKSKAMSQHPDAGGSTDSMRRINEAYQLLKELYRQKN